jgi:signal transduction histidine kinase
MLKQQTKLEEGRINERHRISQDLHDGVLGKIFGTRLGLGFLNVNGDDSTIEKYKNYVDELQNIEKEIRTISHELKSEILSSKEDFSKIIGDLIDQKCNLGTFEYRYKYDQNIDWDVISDDIKINYYRIIQEALQNIIKYAHANKVSVEIKLNDDYLELLIVDDGIGFDVLAKRKGIGLKNIDSRAINIGGKAIINSEFNKGTTIFVTCSIQNNNNE